MTLCSQAISVTESNVNTREAISCKCIFIGFGFSACKSQKKNTSENWLHLVIVVQYWQRWQERRKPARSRCETQELEDLWWKIWGKKKKEETKREVWNKTKSRAWPQAEKEKDRLDLALCMRLAQWGQSDWQRKERDKILRKGMNTTLSKANMTTQQGSLCVFQTGLPEPTSTCQVSVFITFFWKRGQ